MSYEPYYEGGWQSGENGGTPITPDVLNYMDKGISLAYAPYNHLHNSDFTRFVAQAGIAGRHGSQAYAGDRWILDSGTVTGTPNANGEGYSNITLNGTIRQIVASPPADGTVGIEMLSGTAAISYENGEVIIRSAGGVISGATLFAGTYTADNRPSHKPKGYGAELLECMRFYYQNWNGDMSQSTVAGLYVPVDARTMSVQFPVPMRVTPTITLYNPVTGNSGNVADWITDEAISANVVYSSAHHFMMAGDMTAGQMIAYNYAASADL